MAPIQIPRYLNATCVLQYFKERLPSSTLYGPATAVSSDHSY